MTDSQPPLKISRPAKEITIYAAQPPANADSFEHALLIARDLDAEQRAVFYAPSLEAVGSIDNTKSKGATTSYSQTLSSGFTFSSSQSITIGTSVELSFNIAKAGVSIDVTVSFTQQYSKTKSTTIEFSVAPGQRAFTYRGYLLSAVLSYNSRTDEYKYLSEGRFVTDVLATSEAPLKNAKVTFTQL